MRIARAALATCALLLLAGCAIPQPPPAPFPAIINHASDHPMCLDQNNRVRACALIEDWDCWTPLNWSLYRCNH